VASRFELTGGVAVSLDGFDKAAMTYARGQMDPYCQLPGDGSADIVLQGRTHSGAPLLDVQKAAGDRLVTASDGHALWLVDGELACSIPVEPSDRPIRLVVDSGFSLSRVFGELVRPALQLAMLYHDAVAVHSTAVEIDGGGIVVAGWSESGKTETALALMEAGASFLSDKWTVLDRRGRLSAFPIGVGVRRWVLPYLPRLRAGLPPTARAQLRVAGATGALLGPVRRRRARGRVGRLVQVSVEQAVALADRAGLSPSEVRRIYNQTDDPARAVPLRALALLTTVPGGEVSVEAADPQWVAGRLARSAAFERRGFFALQERARFAFPEKTGWTPEESIRQERARLEAGLASMNLLSVRAPFPTDPRRVAEAVAARL